MIETVMTYEEWTREYKRQNKKKKDKIKYYAKQKALGILAIICGIAIPTITGDATISLLLIPVGIYITITRQKVIM